MTQFKESKNVFDGFCLEYYITEVLVQKIKKIAKSKDDIVLYNSLGKPIILDAQKKIVLPMGVFSNPCMKLSCIFLDSTRNFNIPWDNDDAKSNIILNETQELIIEEFDRAAKEIKNKNKAPIYINLVGECSVGKTVMAIYIASRLKMKTAIITPSIDLGQQWAERIETFVENSSVFVSTHGAEKYLSNKIHPDFLIFPSKHLNNTSFVTYLTNNYCVCFIDEQHTYNLAQNDNMKRFFSFNAFPYMISLTATPRAINSVFLGRELYTDEIVAKSKPKKFEKKVYEIKLYKYEPQPYSDHYEKYIKLALQKTIKKDQILYKSLLKKRCLMDDINRLKIIVRLVAESLNEDRKVLLITPFVDNIKVFTEMLSVTKYRDCVFPVYAASSQSSETSLTTVKEKVKELTQYVLIGTEDHLGTGIDIKELDTLHIASVTTNASNLIQYAGRVSRDNITPIHKIFLYNISSHPKIKLDKNCSDMMKVLEKKGWHKNGRVIL